MKRLSLIFILCLKEAGVMFAIHSLQRLEVKAEVRLPAAGAPSGEGAAVQPSALGMNQENRHSE